MGVMLKEIIEQYFLIEDKCLKIMSDDLWSWLRHLLFNVRVNIKVEAYQKNIMQFVFWT